MGFRVKGLGFGVYGLEAGKGLDFRAQGLFFVSGIYSWGSLIWGPEFRAEGSGFKTWIVLVVQKAQVCKSHA